MSMPGRTLTVSAIARRSDTNVGDVSRSLQLAFLAPDLVEAILEGTQPVELRRVMGWTNAKPAPVDFYMAIRDALVEAAWGAQGAKATN